MKVIVDNAIEIRDVNKVVSDWARDNLIIPNPEFYKKERLGKWIGNTTRTIWLYEKNGTDIVLPFGTIQKVWNMHPNKDDWEYKINDFKGAKYTSNINLYPYQEKAVKSAILSRNGLLVMPCGSGKTQSGLELIARLGGKALWLTHTQDLLNQSMNRAKSTLEIDGTFGKITAGKVDIGTHITFATVQTMCKLDLSKLKDVWDIVIVDECQHCCGTPTRVTQFYKVVSNLSARYKIGLTATPKRSDGLEQSMFALLGDVICEISKDDVKHTTCPVEVEQIETRYTPDYNAILMGDGTLNYSAIIDELINDEMRFEIVKDKINECVNKGSVLVLANRVAYLDRLQKACGGKTICLSGMGQSKKAKAQRKEALRKLDVGELNCIFATYQLAKEGLDVPNLRYVIFATPEKDPTTIEQSTGRVGRKADGKDKGIVIDFVDDFGMYKGWARKRRNYYKKIDAKVLDSV